MPPISTLISQRPVFSRPLNAFHAPFADKKPEYGMILAGVVMALIEGKVAEYVKFLDIAFSANQLAE